MNRLYSWLSKQPNWLFYTLSVLFIVPLILYLAYRCMTGKSTSVQEVSTAENILDDFILDEHRTRERLDGDLEDSQERTDQLKEEERRIEEDRNASEDAIDPCDDFDCVDDVVRRTE